MADESTAPEGVENDTALPEGKVEDQVTEATESDEGDETDGDEQEPEFDEYDFGGNKLKLPKGSVPDELRDQVDKFSKGTWADYTRGKQEVAEARKAIEADRAAVDKVKGLSGEILDTYSRGLRVKDELEQLSKVDLGALWQSDPDRARQLSDLRNQKQAEFHSIVNAVDQKEGELNRTQATEMARHVDAGKQTIGRQIKDFETKHLPDVIEYAVAKLGVSKEAATRDWPLNPSMTIAVHKAMMFDRMQATAAKAAKPQPTAPENPITPMKGKGSNTRSLDLNRDADKMSSDEWMKRRIAQVTKRA